MPENGEPLRRLLTTREVAQIAHVSNSTVERRAKAGELHPIRLGPHLLRFDPADVADWIERGRGNGRSVDSRR
jgi:excisionase family DNA binding protein